MLTEIKFNKPQNLSIGNRVYLFVNGNYRAWVVEGHNAAKTSFVVSSTFGG